MKRFPAMTVVCTIIAFLFVAQPAMAQKTKKEEKPKPAAQSTESGSLREILSKHVGDGCNLGTIKKVTAEYVVIEQEGATMIHPLHAIHMVKTFKDEETGADILEIRLIAAD